MMFYMNLLFIVVAVSLDGFGVGITYGMRKIRITIGGLLVIMCCSGFIVVTSMTIGHMIRNIITPSLTSMFGSLILIGLGIFVFFLIALTTTSSKKTDQKSTFKNRKFHRIKAVIDDPTKDAKDNSGSIYMSDTIILCTVIDL